MLLDEDQTLIKKTLRGDRKAFEELMRKYEKKIFSFVVRMVRNDDTAVDLTQDFFFKIFTVLDKYNFEYKFSTWAYRICYNLVIDHIRKNQAPVDSLDDESVTARDLLESDNVSREDGFKADPVALHPGPQVRGDRRYHVAAGGHRQEPHIQGQGDPEKGDGKRWHACLTQS
jgi:RNA polymerase sigma factor (sigma-70 family)